MKPLNFNNVDSENFDSPYPYLDIYSQSIKRGQGNAWKNAFEKLVEYVGTELDYPLWIDLKKDHSRLSYTYDWYNKPGSEYRNYIGEDKEVVVGHYDLMGHLNFEDAWYNVLMLESWKEIYEESLKGSSIWFMQMRYGYKQGIDDPRDIENFVVKWMASANFLNSKAGSPLTREDVVELIRGHLEKKIAVKYDESLPWIPEKTGNSPSFFETGWTYKEVYDARQEVEDLEHL